MDSAQDDFMDLDSLSAYLDNARNNRPTLEVLDDPEPLEEHDIDPMRDYLAIMEENSAHLDAAETLVRETVEDAAVHHDDVSAEALEQAQAEQAEERRLDDAAIIIQGAARGVLARRARAMKEAERDARITAVQTVQRAVRCHLARETVHRLLEEREQAIRRNTAAIAIQRVYRMHAVRQRYMETRRAVVSVQRAYRRIRDAPALKAIRPDTVPAPHTIIAVTGRLLVPTHRQPAPVDPPLPTPPLSPGSPEYDTYDASDGLETEYTEKYYPHPWEVTPVCPSPLYRVTRPPHPEAALVASSAGIQAQVCRGLNLVDSPDTNMKDILLRERREYEQDAERFLMDSYWVMPTPTDAITVEPIPMQPLPPLPDPDRPVIDAVIAARAIHRAALAALSEVQAFPRPTTLTRPHPTLAGPPVARPPPPILDGDPMAPDVKAIAGTQTARSASGVTELDFSYRPLPGPDQPLLSDLFPNVTGLTLSRTPGIGSGALHRALAGHARLTHLTVSHAPVYDMAGVAATTLVGMALVDLCLAAVPALQCPNLRLLTLSRNHITSLPSLPSMLTRLDLAGNSIPALDGALAGCRHLRHLDLSDNELSTFPALPLPQLTHLFLAGNRLTTLTSAFRLPGLRVLWVQRNRLTSLGGWASAFPGLESLVVADNAIEAIGPSPAACLLMVEVDLSGNAIADYTSLKHLSRAAPNLRRLQLGQNPVVETGRRAFVRTAHMWWDLDELNHEEPPTPAPGTPPDPEARYLRSIGLRVRRDGRNAGFPAALQLDTAGMGVDPKGMRRRHRDRHSPLEQVRRRRAWGRTVGLTPAPTVELSAIFTQRRRHDALSAAITRRNTADPLRLALADAALDQVAAATSPTRIGLPAARIEAGEQRMREAADRLQHWWRHVMVGRAMLVAVATMMRLKKNRRRRAAETIVRHVRRFRVRQAQLEEHRMTELKRLDARRHRQADAAIVIQRLARGWLGRRRIRRQVAAARAAKARAEEQERQEAARLQHERLQKERQERDEWQERERREAARRATPPPQPAPTLDVNEVTADEWTSGQATEALDDFDLKWIDDLDGPGEVEVEPDIEAAVRSKPGTAQARPDPPPAQPPALGRAARPLLSRPDSAVSDVSVISSIASTTASSIHPKANEQEMLKWAEHYGDEEGDLAQAYMRNRKKYTAIRRKEAKKQFLADPLSRLQTFRKKAGIPSPAASVPSSARAQYPRPPRAPPSDTASPVVRPGKLTARARPAGFLGQAINMNIINLNNQRR